LERFRSRARRDHRERDFHAQAMARAPPTIWGSTSTLLDAVAWGACVEGSARRDSRRYCHSSMAARQPSANCRPRSWEAALRPPRVRLRDARAPRALRGRSRRTWV
jgi:hypothetical protein